MKYFLIDFANCKSGDLLLTRRSERRYAERGGVEGMLHRENKLFVLLLFSCLLLFVSCKRMVKYDAKEIQTIRERSIEISQAIVGENEYWNVYNQLNDSIRNWRNHTLRWYDEDSTLVQFNVDSLFCFNKQGNKMITTRLGIGFSKNDVMDAIIYYYGVKIKEQWYFFSAATMYVPREFYQEDIHTPLSFEKLKQIATSNIYRGYLKKGRKGQWEINERFFQDLTSVAWCADCITQEQWDSAYMKQIHENWSKRDTTNFE